MDLFGLGRRQDADLARYARLEYGSPDVGWFLASVAADGMGTTPVRGWIRRAAQRLRDRRFRTTIGPRDPGPDGAGPDPPRAPRDTCGHPDLAFLGRGGTTEYYRCARCGAAFIEQGSRVWTIQERAPRPSG